MARSIVFMLLVAGCGGSTTELGSVPESVQLDVASASLGEDRVTGTDAGVTPDGIPDGVFDAVIQGPVRQLSLISTLDDGTPCCRQQYDTLVGSDPIPAAMANGFDLGASTWVLGVRLADQGQLLNGADGSIAPLEEGEHRLELYGTDSGFFFAGDAWKLVVETDEGVYLESNVVLHP